MRNLVRFFWRYHYTFLFLVLQVIGFSMIVRFNQFHQSHFLNATQELSGTLYLAVNNVTEYIDLKRTNEELLAENAALREAFPEAFLDLRTTPVVTLDTVYQQQYEYIGAEVINNTTHLRNNFLTLNKGALAGLEADMGVIGPHGIIGVVQHVSPHYATVMSVLHRKFQVGAKLKQEQFFHILHWDERDPRMAVLSNIPNHARVQVGDTVVTRGSSAIFPGGIPIGTVANIEDQEEGQFYRLTVQLATDFYNVNFAYVIRNRLKIEQQTLEDLMDPEPNE